MRVLESHRQNLFLLAFSYALYGSGTALLIPALHFLKKYNNQHTCYLLFKFSTDQLVSYQQMKISLTFITISDKNNCQMHVNNPNSILH